MLSRIPGTPSCGLSACVRTALGQEVRIAEGSQLGFLLRGHFGDGLRVQPERSAGDEDGCQNDCGQLFFKFWPHNKGE